MTADALATGDPIRADLSFRRILLTGANGFVGRYLVPALVARLGQGSALTLATRVQPTDGRYDWVPFDLADMAGVSAALAEVRPDLVIHLAAQASVGRSSHRAADTWATNLGGSLALARAIAATVPDCTVLHISSAEIYGLSFNEGIVTEASPTWPQSAYARSKAAAEAMFYDVLPPSTRLMVARPSNHSGPGQDDRFVIPAFAAQIAAVERGTLARVEVGNLDAERDFLDVRDVVAAYVALLSAAPSLPSRNLFNISSGKAVRIGAILDRLCSIAGIEAEVMAAPHRKRASEVPRAVADSSALRVATGWCPAYDLDTTLADVLAEHRTTGRTVSAIC